MYWKMNGRDTSSCYQLKDVPVTNLSLVIHQPAPVLKGGKLDLLVLTNHHTNSIPEFVIYTYLYKMLMYFNNAL